MHQKGRRGRLLTRSAQVHPRRSEKGKMSQEVPGTRLELARPPRSLKTTGLVARGLTAPRVYRFRHPGVGGGSGGSCGQTGTSRPAILSSRGIVPQTLSGAQHGLGSPAPTSSCGRATARRSSVRAAAPSWWPRRSRRRSSREVVATPSVAYETAPLSYLAVGEGRFVAFRDVTNALARLQPRSGPHLARCLTSVRPSAPRGRTRCPRLRPLAVEGGGFFDF